MSEGDVTRKTGKPKKVNKLSDLSIDEVSLVDRGANQHAEVLIHKRDELNKAGAPQELKNSAPGAKDCTACDGKGSVPDGEGGITECSVCGGSGEVSKADPDPTDVSTSELDEEEEEVLEAASEVADEDEETSKSFFSRLVTKMFGGNSDEELTTEPEEGGTLSDMSEEVEKVGGMNPGMQLPYGMQQQGVPAPGPQGMMPQQQAFPAAPGQMPGQMQAGPPLPAEVIQYIQQLEQALAQAQGEGQETPGQNDEEEQVNPFGKSAENLEEDEVAFLQELAKNLEDEDNREAIQKALDAVEKANERAEEAETIAKAERDFRLNQEYITKARSLVNLPINAEEFGPVLKRLNETMEEEEVESIMKALSAANESIADAGVFTEVGKRGGGQFETVSKVDAAATDLVEKSDGDLSMEQAREQVLESNPALYDEYLQETGR